MSSNRNRDDDSRKSGDGNGQSQSQAAAAAAAKAQEQAAAIARAKEADARMQAAADAQAKAELEAANKAKADAQAKARSGDDKNGDSRDKDDDDRNSPSTRPDKSSNDKSHTAAGQSHDDGCDGDKSGHRAGNDDDKSRGAKQVDHKSGDDDGDKSGHRAGNDDDKSRGTSQAGQKSGDDDGDKQHHAGGGDKSGDGKDCSHERSHDGGTTPVVTPPVVTPPVVTPPVVTPPVLVTPPAPVESVVLKTADVSNVGSGATQIGTRHGDSLDATTGHDVILGKGGNDTIHGADVMTVSLALPIDGALVNAANADAVSFLVSGMPAGAALSAGQDNGNGTWSLTKVELSGLAITASNNSDFTLNVSATATDGSGLVQSAAVHVAMHAGEGNLLSGGSGNDTIYGSANGDDDIYGGGIPTGLPTHAPTVADNDTIFVGNGTAHVWGQAGDDTIWAGTGKDVISGGTGNDTIHAGSGQNVVHGNAGDDVLFAGTGTGVLSGGDGNDIVKADGGSYTVYGGAGYDTLDFSGAANGVTVDLHNHTASGAGDLTVKGIEAVVGSAHNDVIWGDAGGTVMTGNGGADTFGFHLTDVKKGAVAHITDYNLGDTLDLSDLLRGRSADGLVKVTDGANGETVSVKFGGSYHDVVVLDNVHGLSAQDVLHHGSLLA